MYETKKKHRNIQRIIFFCAAAVWTFFLSADVLYSFDVMRDFQKNPDSGITSEAQPDSRVNTSLPMFITADNLSYGDETSEIFGSGNVILRHDDAVIFADNIYINPENGDIAADGNVLMLSGPGRIYTDKIYYNFKTNNAYTKQADVIMPPWICKGKKLKKEGGKLELETPVFTTCNKEKPHYRMEASMIYLYDDERIEAWHTTVYLGKLPVAYFPYYMQSMKGDRVPFNFRVSHNETTGWQISAAQNIYWNKYNYGTFRYNYIEKTGNSFPLDLNYGFARNSLGRMNLLYHFDRWDRANDRWSLLWQHDHVFDTRSKANAKISTASDGALEKDFISSPVNMDRTEAYAYYSKSFDNHSFTLSVSDIQNLTYTAAGTDEYGDTAYEPVYRTTSRKLPEFSYIMNQINLFNRVYYDHRFSLSRQYMNTMNTPDEEKGDYYFNTGKFESKLTYSVPAPGIMSLTGRGGMSGSWEYKEKHDPFLGFWMLSANISETLRVNIIPGYMNFTLTHSMAKQMNDNEDMKYTGITSNTIGIKAYAGLKNFNINLNTNYNMLLDRDELRHGSDFERFSNIAATGSGNWGPIRLNASGGYNIYANTIKNLNVRVYLNDEKMQQWSVAAGTSFVNNLIDNSGYQTENPVSDNMQFDMMMNFALTEEFRFSISRTYDLMTKELDTHSYSVKWYVHCWEADISWIKRKDGIEDINFSIFISAMPGQKFNKPSSTAPNYNMLFDK